MSPSAFPGADAAGPVLSAVGCALGDISGDAVPDLLVLVADPTSGVQRLQALAGPDFQDVLWQKASSLSQVLQCAPDLDLDGTLDPIVQTLGEAAGTAAAGATDQAQHQVQQVLDGASGAALVGRVGAETVTGVAAPAAGAAAGAAREATSVLLPAAAGAAAFLQTEATTALIPIPGGVPLPLDALTATATASAQLQILDAAGAVVATINIDQPGVVPLAMAPLALTGGLPDVAVLTSTLSPVQQAASGVPELALYAADGSLAWATQLPASTGLPILIPQAGDLNLDGVGDLIVTTVQQGMETAPGAAYQVLSGVDGQILFDSGAAVTGLMAALPLGQLPGGAALLQVASVESTGSLALSALDGAGSILWSVDVSGLAVPVNAALDAHTGDLTGFTDLTGDAIPDVAVAVQQGSDLALQAIDGLTGEIAWNITLSGVDHVVPVLVGTASTLTDKAAGAAGLATGAVAGVQAGATAALLALGASASEATLALIDPVTGKLQWTATAAVSTSAEIVGLAADMAGDLDGDGIQDLLVTAVYAGASVEAPSGAVAAISGQTGESLFAAAADPAGTALEFKSNFGPAAAAAEQEAESSSGIPAPGAALLALALVVGALVRRRRA